MNKCSAFLSTRLIMAMAIGLGLASFSSQSVHAAGAVPADTPTRASMILQMGLPTYAALEYCDVGEGRLDKMKQRMRKMASQQGVSAASFDAAFKAGLAKERKAVIANAAAHPEQTRKFCEAERGGL